MQRLKFNILLAFFYGAVGLLGQERSSVRLQILGNVQDGGAPHIGCKKVCCTSLTEAQKAERKVTALGLFLNEEKTHYLFEATPDITEQWTTLINSATTGSSLEGIFLTHAHIGHYAGLQFLGKEALGGKMIPVFAMPRMKTFLETNGPWSQLVTNQNIDVQPLKNKTAVALSKTVRVTPIQVPHRDEFSETVGYFIQGPTKTALFLPDIDKWERWERILEDVLQQVDYAFIDATFFDAAEINYRDIAAIPHPFVIETLARLAPLPLLERQKVYFIHLNHTNPLLDPNSSATKTVLSAGMHIARKGMYFML